MSSIGSLELFLFWLSSEYLVSGLKMSFMLLQTAVPFPVDVLGLAY